MKKFTEKNLTLVDTTYEGELTHKGKWAELFIETAGDEKKAPMLIDYANEFLAWFEENEEEIKKYAAQKMLKLKNKTWLEPKEKPATEKDFLKKMKIDSVSINSDKSAILFFDAGNLFTDHSIIIDVSKNKKLTDAYL
jgi:hypothetical protein